MVSEKKGFLHSLLSIEILRGEGATPFFESENLNDNVDFAGSKKGFTRQW